MELGYGIGDRVIQIEDQIKGKVIDMYYPTTGEQQTMIICDDGRKYHAPSRTFTKIAGLGEQAGVSAGQLMSQPLLATHDYRDIKVTDDMTISIDLEEIKRQMYKSHYQKSGLDYGRRRK